MVLPPVSRTLPFALALSLAFLAACESTEPKVATTLEQVTGDQQTAEVGTAVPVAPSVRVLDQNDSPLADATVTFSVTAGGGSVANSSATTNASGVASAGAWILGTEAGPNSVSASGQGLSPVRFNATGTPGPAAAVEVAGGDGQEAQVTEEVPTAPSVRVTDQYGNAKEGVQVTFAVSSGGGEVTGATQTSGSDGIATVGGWTLGEQAGENTLTASIQGGASAVITATATAGEPAELEKEAGDEQTGTVGMPVAEPPSVQVFDAFGNPVPGVTVTFTASGGGEAPPAAVEGSVEPSSTETDQNGVAAVTSWTLGTVVGENTLTADVDGVGSVVFTATSTADVAASMAAHAGQGQGAPVGSEVPVDPEVVVTDQYGNAVPGVAVEFVVTGGGGSVQGADQETDPQGVARVGAWTLGTTPGTNTLEARSDGLDAVVFTATATQEPASIQISSGNNQSATVGASVPQPLVVVVRDAVNNPVPGVSVAWAVTAGDGSVAAESSMTNSSGMASLSGWTLGILAGTNTVSATVGPLAPVTFTATGTADVAAALSKVAGDGQTATISTAVAIDPSVLVQDQYGNAVAGTQVTFQVTSGGGSVTGATPTTNASGIAAVGSWTLGSSVGTNTLEASVSGLTPVVFQAEAEMAPPSFNMWIESVHLNQGNQNLAGTGGSVAGRGALLRVVTKANESNSHTPSVRLRLYQSGTLLSDQTITAPRTGVPTSPSLETLTDTWNVVLAPGDVVAGLEVVAELDPGGSIPDNTPSDNRFPAAGRGSLDVATLPPLNVVFIPVVATVQGTTGDVNAGNTGVFLESTRDIQPHSTIAPTIHGSFTTGLDLSVASNWGTLLGDIQSLRTAESATDEYYHGIIGDFAGIPYGGLGYVPFSPGSSFRSAISYDRAPFEDGTVAHELGHNLGRSHAPCGGPSSPDPSYPHGGGLIGPPGYDVDAGTLVSGVGTYDYMSYCDPAWTSDYTFREIVDWRRSDPLASPPGASASPPAPKRGLLVGGRMTDEGMVLTPAFELDAAPVLPTEAGPYRLRATAADGGVVFDLSFQGTLVEDGPADGERHFAWFVPLAEDDLDAVARLELTGPQGVETLEPTTGPPAAPGAGSEAPGYTIAAGAGGSSLLSWDGGRFPMALVRDALTGDVLSIARGGEAALMLDGVPMDRLEVLVSNGVSSVAAVRR